jgi:hypothetical protein
MHCPHCGAEFDTKKRSRPDHARLFALIHAAYQQWPEASSFQPANSEDLRAWLICKAGPEFRRSTPILLDPDADEATKEVFRIGIQEAIKAATGKAFVIPFGSGVAVVAPVSMSFSRMDQRTFSRLRDAITDIIEAELGCKVEDLAKEAA